MQAPGEETPISGVHLEALDRETRPQDDFYQFVNGGWLDEETINAAGITAIAFELGKVEDIIDTESLVRTMAELEKGVGYVF